VKDLIMNKGYPSHPKDKTGTKTVNNSMKMPYRFTINK